nr:hypothetical protein [Tanacetum cinerariifolium]
MKNDVPNNSSNNPLLEEVDLFLSDNSIPPGIENVADDLEGDIRFLEELLIDDSILSYESFDSNFEVISAVMEDNDEPDEHFNPGGEIFVFSNIEDVDYFPFMFVIRIFLPYLIFPEISPLLLSAKSEDTIFNPDLKELAEYDKSTSKDRPFFLNDNEDHSIQNKESLENSSNEIDASSSNQEKEEPPQDFDIQKEFLCIHDNVEDLIESALNSKLLSINSQRLDNKEQEVKNVVEQPAERGNHKPEHSLSMGYEHLSITPETESNEVTESNAENHLPIPSECEVTLRDKRKCDLPVSENSTNCDNHFEILFDSKDDDDILVYDDDFEDIEYVEALLSDPEIVNVEEENVVYQAEENHVSQQAEEEIDLEDIFQIQDIVLCEKLLSITRLISNIESLNDNPTPDRVLNSFESDNSLSDTFSPEFKTFCNHMEETRSGNTTHADNSLPEYDSFCFEIEPDQERLIYILKNNIPDDSNDPLLEESNLFLASDNSIPLGIENIADDSEGDDDPSIPRPLPEPPDAETNAGEEIPVVINDKDKFDEDYYFFMFDKVFSLLSAESEDTIFDPGISA